MPDPTITDRPVPGLTITELALSRTDDYLSGSDVTAAVSRTDDYKLEWFCVWHSNTEVMRSCRVPVLTISVSCPEVMITIIRLKRSCL